MNEHDGGIDEKTFEDLACEVQDLGEKQLLVPLERGLFECDIQSYVQKEDVLDVCRFQMLTGESIVAYVR